MRVALVCPYDWCRPGGVRAHVGHLARWLGTAGHEVRVFAPASGRPGDDGPRVVPLGRPVPVAYNRSVAPVALSPLAARRTARELRRFAPDVVHVHEPLAPLVAVGATALGPGPLVGTFHAWSSSDRLYRLLSPVARRIAGRLDARIAVSGPARQFAAHGLGLPPSRWRVIPNGVDAAAFASGTALPELVDPGRPLLLFVGRLEPRKGLDVLISAFLRLRASRPRLRLCVVGDGPERARCQELIPPSIRPDALFVGSVAPADLPRYHASADVFVAPATGGESFGIVLLEAMAAALPVVASDIPGYRAVMRDGRQGRVVRAGDSLALSEALGALLANAHLRAAMAAQGRQTAAAHDWPVVGRRIERVYSEVAPAAG
ncbi:MAG: glycosyltransferase family 4 protein [Actinobacteria bacterium]|nr:glycosyltransferase family 4 protein [Actinomycetota bacterium]